MSKSSINYEQLVTLIDEKKAYLFDYQEDGLLLFTKDGSQVHRLPDLTNESLQAARDFLNCPPTENLSPPSDIPTDPECDGISLDLKTEDDVQATMDHVLTVNLRLDTLYLPNTVLLLNDAISNHMDTAQILLRFQFQEQPSSWSGLLASFCNHWRTIKDKNRLRITLSGTFGRLSDEDFDFFVANNIQLEYVYPFVKGESHFTKESSEVISQIAGKGLRLPIVWYIDENTIQQVLPLIDEAMFLNFNSGFSVPLSHYSLFANASREPDEESYLSLLADLYERYIFYDDVLFPLDFTCINTLKMGETNFWKIMTFVPESSDFSLVPMSELDMNIFAFFSRLFLWQRWESMQADARSRACL